MTALRTAVATALCALAVAGCGVGPGASAGEAELTVTRDYGSRLLVRERAEVSESDTVIRLLDREAEIETRYGGGFVQSIDGVAGGVRAGRRHDWFFYVNGVESSVGAAEYPLADGDRVWWDHHDWTSAMRAPAVVGSWPEPFLHGFAGAVYRTSVGCHAARGVCDRVAQRLHDAGVELDSAADADAKDGEEAVVLVGSWRRIRSHRDAGLLAEGPERSGVFAAFRGHRGVLLDLLDVRGEVARTLGHGSGLVAALRPDDRGPTWVVTGTDAAGVDAAAELLGDALGDRFAVAVDGDGEPVGVPTP